MPQDLRPMPDPLPHAAIVPVRCGVPTVDDDRVCVVSGTAVDPDGSGLAAALVAFSHGTVRTVTLDTVGAVWSPNTVPTFDTSAAIIDLASFGIVSNRMFTLGRSAEPRIRETTSLLRGIFPELAHEPPCDPIAMLRRMAAIDPVRLRLVIAEIRNAWISRMHTVLAALPLPKLLVWWPHPHQDVICSGGPPLIDQAMIRAVRPAGAAIILPTLRRGKITPPAPQSVLRAAASARAAAGAWR